MFFVRSMALLSEQLFTTISFRKGISVNIAGQECARWELLVNILPCFGGEFAQLSILRQYCWTKCIFFSLSYFIILCASLFATYSLLKLSWFWMRLIIINSYTKSFFVLCICLTHYGNLEGPRQYLRAMPCPARLLTIVRQWWAIIYLARIYLQRIVLCAPVSEIVINIFFVSSCNIIKPMVQGF